MSIKTPSTSISKGYKVKNNHPILRFSLKATSSNLLMLIYMKPLSKTHIKYF